MVQDKNSVETTDEAKKGVKKSNLVNFVAGTGITLIVSLILFTVFSVIPNLFWFNMNIQEQTAIVQSTTNISGKGHIDFFANVKLANGEIKPVRIQNSFFPYDMEQIKRFAEVEEFSKKGTVVCLQTSGLENFSLNMYQVARFKEGSCK